MIAPNDCLLKPKEVAKLLGMSRARFYEHAEKPECVILRRGRRRTHGRWKYLQSSVVEHMREELPRDETGARS